MKQGKSLQDLAKEITRQNDTKKDFLASTENVTASLVNYSDRPEITDERRLKIDGHGDFTITRNCHDQISNRLGITRNYYDRILEEAPELWEENLNYWFARKSERRMVRTLDGRARAFLSERYRPLDNYELANTVLPIIVDLGCSVESCELTEKRLYLKCVNARIQGEIKKDDIVQAGVVISNSEVGCGSIKVEPLVYRLSCLNGMISNDFAMRKYHVGRRFENEAEEAEQFFADTTRKADDHAFWLKVKDIVKGSLTEALFHQIVAKMKTAAGIEVKDPVKAVEVLSKKTYMTGEESAGILGHLIAGKDFSLYGVVNAVTRQAQDLADYDRSTDFERIGGEILMTPSLIGLN